MLNRRKRYDTYLRHVYKLSRSIERLENLEISASTVAFVSYSLKLHFKAITTAVSTLKSELKIAQ